MADRITPEQREQLSAVGAASGLGCAIVATLLVCIGGGVILDQYFDTMPVMTLVGVAIGLVGAGYQLWELAQIGNRDQSPPLTRGMARIAKPASRMREAQAKRHEVDDDVRTQE